MELITLGLLGDSVYLPKFRLWPGTQPIEPGSQPRKAVVFIHGILSSHHAFEKMASSFRQCAGLQEWELCFFDYDFHNEMPNSAQYLINGLRGRYNNNDRVILVCHSMGGLVARLALLQNEMPFVKRLIMLATPNFGALRTSQLGLISHLVLWSTRKLYGIYTTRTGILDLRQAADIVDEIRKSENVRPNLGYIDNIDYVTIPGTYFHDRRRSSIAIGSWDQWNIWTGFFAALNLSTQALTAYKSVLGVKLGRPHDGIVEEESNSLIPAEHGRESEKTSSIVKGRLGPAPPTYAHVTASECQSCTHVMVAQNDDIIALVAALVQTEENLLDWARTQTLKNSRLPQPENLLERSIPGFSPRFDDMTRR